MDPPSAEDTAEAILGFVRGLPKSVLALYERDIPWLLDSLVEPEVEAKLTTLLCTNAAAALGTPVVLKPFMFVKVLKNTITILHELGMVSMSSSSYICTPGVHT